MGMIDDRAFIYEGTLEKLKELVGKLIQESEEAGLNNYDPYGIKEIRDLDPEFYFDCKYKYENKD